MGKDQTCSKFHTSSSPLKTEQTNRGLPITGDQSKLTIEFANVAGSVCTASPLRNTIRCFAELPGFKVKNVSNVYAEVGGASNHGIPGGELSFKGTGKGVGFILPQGANLIGSIEANYKRYKDENNVKTMGVRSTDFHRILTKDGKQFWIIVLHLPVGNPTELLHKLKRYRILKSVFAQAHRVQEQTQKPVFVVGDFNMTRGELSEFKYHEEGKPSARGTILIPKSTGDTTIGNFKTCFRFDWSENVNLYTNYDFAEKERTGIDVWWDIDHIFVPTNQYIEYFSIDRSNIGQVGLDDCGNRQILDHATITMRVRL